MDSLPELLKDPAFRKIAGRFVTELSSRTAEMNAAIQDGRLEDVFRLAHRMKGAGGGLGFPQISFTAAAVEQQASSQDVNDALPLAMRQLEDACSKAIEEWSSDPDQAEGSESLSSAAAIRSLPT